MGLPTALNVAAEFDSVLPTPRLVDAIYEAADLKLAPQPLPASDEMRSTAYLVRHDTLIAAQRAYAPRQGMHSPPVIRKILYSPIGSWTYQGASRSTVGIGPCITRSSP
jgi:hypothetical protein